MTEKVEVCGLLTPAQKLFSPKAGQKGFCLLKYHLKLPEFYIYSFATPQGSSSTLTVQ